MEGTKLRRIARRVRRRQWPGRPVSTLPRRLHLGSGDVWIKGWYNVDIDPANYPDIVDDVVLLGRFPESHASSIYACHVLEHLATGAVPGVLDRWHQVLQPGGELRISVPDLDRIVRIYAANWEHFQTDGNTPCIGVLYGGQTDAYDFHRTGFNFVYLRRLLLDAGFLDVEEYPHEPHFLGISDASIAREPFGEYISLNVKARRP